jgi:hypothetical protein
VEKKKKKKMSPVSEKRGGIHTFGGTVNVSPLPIVLGQRDVIWAESRKMCAKFNFFHSMPEHRTASRCSSYSTDSVRRQGTQCRPPIQFFSVKGSPKDLSTQYTPTSPTIKQILTVYRLYSERTHLAIDRRLGNVKLSNHTKRNGATTWLGIVHLTFEEDSVDVLLLGEDFGSACSGRSTTHYRHLVLHVKL